jgi:phosphomethylpyrimidine synthase
MATLLDQLQNGEIPENIRIVAEDEQVPVEVLVERVRAGHVVIPHNNRRTFRPMGIGLGLTTKINANIGTSPSHFSIEEEKAKLGVSVEAGADSVMDLSTGGDLRAIRTALLDQCPIMMGSVPIYYLSAVLAQQKREIIDFTVDELFEAIDEQCASGIDYITVHCGTTRSALAALASSDRVMGIVSRGGSIIAAWMKRHNAENPLYEFYDRLLDICRKYDVTLSLGDSLRPGSIVDATDRGQIEELIVLGDLARRARAAGVQAMIEGPGHVPLDQVAANVQIQKRLCDGAPFYVLGPLTTDIAPGYDHITAAIGGAVAAMAGADFLCYVTPAEHLTLPNLKDVRQGVIAAKIAAHSGDIAKGLPQAIARDRAMSEARNRLDWESMYNLCLDPVVARARRRESEDADNEVCTMCGELCAIRTYRKSVEQP